jgi:hypothetical protein
MGGSVRASLLLLGWFLGGLAGLAQEKVVQDFTGTNAIATPPFQITDGWEVRWDAPVSITVFNSGGALVAGAAGAAQGSLYQPGGGKFSLKIDGKGPWHVSVVELGSVPMTALASTPYANYFPPTDVSASTNSTFAAAPGAPGLSSWSSVLTAPPPPELTSAQAHAVVVIKGDRGEGTGFLARTTAGPAVITNLHVIDANPHLRILTTTGAEIAVLSLKGATDRDLAMFMIKDNHYNYFDLAGDVAATVRKGDMVITPGDSEGGEVVLDTKGAVLGIGPDRVEITNPIYHGNSGGPVFDLTTGKVIGVVSFGARVRPTDELDKASAASANSAISGAMRYFALRVDTVPTWETYDWDRFLAQSFFLKNFEEISRCLDSLLNGKRYEKLGLTSMNPEEGFPSSRYYMLNEKIRGIADTFRRETADADSSDRLDAQRELVMDLQGLVDHDAAAIQNSNNFYSFEQMRARHDYGYRQELKKELNGLDNKVSDLGH